MKKYSVINIGRSFFVRLLVMSVFLLTANIAIAQDDTTTVIAAPKEEETDEYVDEEQDKKDSYFKEKKSGENFTVSQRNVSEKAYKEIKSDDAFWYVENNNAKEKTKATSTQGQKGQNGQSSQPPKVKDQQEKKVYVEEEPAYTPVSQRGWFKTLMLVIAIIGFAAIVGWYLASSNVGFFRKKDVKESETISEEEMPEDIFAINYQKEIDKAAAEGNYRLAIRLQYLRLLKQFAEKNIIQYKQDKTNFDYISELYSSAYYTQFFRITRNYEYSWYGKFAVSGEAYRLISSDFEQLAKQMTY